MKTPNPPTHMKTHFIKNRQPHPWLSAAKVVLTLSLSMLVCFLLLSQIPNNPKGHDLLLGIATLTCTGFVMFGFALMEIAVEDWKKCTPWHDE
jgi:hypothetical protein